ncbi:MAG TPA: rhomboid family intramembrane serine protease [Polyangia bacterium]|nr:rhomboid family intramembrane serine protease [Polyangia bacterium]
MPDLPPRRAARTSGARPIIGRLSPAIKALLIAQAVIYAIFLLVRPLRPLMEAHLAVGPGLFAGEYWQLATGIFLHLDPTTFLWNVVGLWWAGADVERAQGTRRMVALFLVGGVLTNLAYAAVDRYVFGTGSIFGGSSFAVLTLIVAFGRIYGRTPMSIFGAFSVQARYISIALVGWYVVMALAGPVVSWPSLAATATATVVGYFLGVPGGLEALWDALKLRRLRRRYRVIDGGAGRPPKKYVN